MVSSISLQSLKTTTTIILLLVLSFSSVHVFVQCEQPIITSVSSIVPNRKIITIATTTRTTRTTKSRKGSSSTVSLAKLHDDDDSSSVLSSSTIVKLTQSFPRGGGRLLRSMTNKKSVQPIAITISEPVVVRSNNNNKFLHTIKVGWYFTLWYGLNVWYNIINKQLLNKVPSSVMIGTIQLGIGSLYVLLLWLLRLRGKPIVTNNELIPYWNVGVMHSIGQLCSMISLMSGTVSFTHIVKALEPFFSALVTIVVDKTIMPWPVYCTLIPVVGGVGYACMNEASFSWISLFAAMASNVAFAFRAVLSKGVMIKISKSTSSSSSIGDSGSPTKSKNLTPVNIFGIVTILSFLISIPIALVVEGGQFIKLWQAAVTPLISNNLLVQQLIITGIVHYLNNEVMYMALSNVHPITLAVGNTIKRIVIIVASVLAFGTEITKQASIGSAIGISGVLLYSLTKQYYEKLEITKVLQIEQDNKEKEKETTTTKGRKQPKQQNPNKIESRTGTRKTTIVDSKKMNSLSRRQR